MVGIEEDSVRYAHSGPSQRFLRGLRPLVSVGPLPLPVSAGGHASSIPTINPPELYHIKYEADPFGSASRCVYWNPAVKAETNDVNATAVPLTRSAD